MGIEIPNECRGCTKKGWDAIRCHYISLVPPEVVNYIPCVSITKGKGSVGREKSKNPPVSRDTAPGRQRTSHYHGGSQ